MLCRIATLLLPLTIVACATTEDVAHDRGDATTTTTETSDSIDVELSRAHSRDVIATLHHDRTTGQTTMRVADDTSAFSTPDLTGEQADELTYRTWRLHADHEAQTRITCDASYTCDDFEVYGMSCTACVYLDGNCDTKLNVGCHITQ